MNVLDRRVFESVFSVRPEVSLAVMRVLCKRLVESEARQAPNQSQYRYFG